MKGFYLLVSFALILISCNRFNSLNENSNLEKKSNTNPDKTFNLNQGIYYCKNCNSKLYSTHNKFSSNEKNESFDKSIKNNVEYDIDYRVNNIKTELKCKNCGIQIGNVWSDGPKESTGNRHCVTKNALFFKSINNRK
tara:strand:- start:221 stop:634 length:414 start_codon:yes stop_codon:yes gene_type:complete